MSRGLGLLVYSLGAVSMPGCAESGELTKTHVEADFVAVELEIAGGTCGDCWRRLRVEAPDVGVFSDDSRVVRVAVEPDDYASVIDHVISDAFQAATERPARWNCDIEPSIVDQITVTWADGVESARLSDACFAPCSDAEHPLMRLKRLLFSLKRTYVTCNDEWVSTCRTAPETPPGGMLCLECRDECGTD